MTNYRFKNNIKINKTNLSKEMGYSRQLLSSILNGKKTVMKAMAFYITKTINPDANIEDFFDIEK